VIVVGYDYFGSVLALLISIELMFGDSLVPSIDVAACRGPAIVPIALFARFMLIRARM
jgi:hypothetical protein